MYILGESNNIVSLISDEFVKELKIYLFDIRMLGYSARKFNNTIFIYRRNKLICVYYQKCFNFYEFDDFILIKLKSFLTKGYCFKLNLTGKQTCLSLLHLLEIGHEYSMLKNINLNIGNYLIKTIGD